MDGDVLTLTSPTQTAYESDFSRLVSFYTIRIGRPKSSQKYALLQKVVLLNILKVLVSVNLKFTAGGLIGHNDCMWM